MPRGTLSALRRPYDAFQSNRFRAEPAMAAVVAALPATVTDVNLEETRCTFVVPGKEKGKYGEANRHPATREEVDALRRFFQG